jgi:hypothetical protein
MMILALTDLTVTVPVITSRSLPSRAKKWRVQFRESECKGLHIDYNSPRVMKIVRQAELSLIYQHERVSGFPEASGMSCGKQKVVPVYCV